MSEILTQKDYYDKNGILLLAKGVKASDALIERLKKYGDYELEQDRSGKIPPNKEVIKASSQLQERIQIRNDQIMEYPNQILSTIIFKSKARPWWLYVNALSNYVGWLYTHSIDVAILSLMIAIEMKYDDKSLWNLGLGSFLHDVGKLLIPKAVIQRPGLPSDMDMTCIKQHCELGMSSLRPYGLSKDSLDIILQHHERLDGSGYPAGLRANKINQNTQIVMIADLVDEMTSGRPHRPIHEIDSAINILTTEQEKYSQECVAILRKIVEQNQ